MAAKGVAGHIIGTVATVVTQLAKVGGLLLMDTLSVKPHLRVGAKGLVTLVTRDTAYTCVEGLMGIKAIAASGPKVTVVAYMGFQTFMFEGHVLAQATFLLTGERA